VAVALGYAATVERTTPDTVGEATGISEALLASVAESSKLSAGTRWVVAASALVALLWTATSAARAIRAVHSIAWLARVERVGRPLRAGLLLLATIAAFALVFGVAGRARAQLGVAGLTVSIAFFAIWLGVASLLPHGRAPLSALIPRAIVFAAGVQLVHLATVLFIAGRVDRASATYGSLGVAFTVLLWLYVASRVIVASAMLNAALWEQSAAGPPRPTGTSERP
jgi:uncharacterized BrkB/YihY/UPF0761 family membrane protein